jgi:hypothetical protein
MRAIKTNQIIVLILILFTFFYGGCKKNSDNNNSSSQDIWDIDKNGIPKFVKTNYIELTKIGRISKFRSSIGHDYSDAFEHCRSMKHYFEPASNVDWASVKIYAPVTGKVTRVEQEWAGTKVEIASNAYPAFRFSIFHINLSVNLQVGSPVTEGMLLGTHIGAQTMSDISVIVNDPTRQGRMVSYFDVMTDEVFNAYISRGVGSRSTMIISKTERDAHPLECNGDTFIGTDPLENWMVLQ